jgi:TrmH family RNA methyltransferase
MSLPILLTQLRVANVRTLASVAHVSSDLSAELRGTTSEHGTASERGGANLLLPWEIDWCEPTALLVGNEGAGLPEEIARSADARVRIPMASGAESLNAAAAAAVLFYEAARQRSRQNKEASL